MLRDIPTFDEHAAEVLERIINSATHRKPLTPIKDQEGNAVEAAEPYTGWTMYGYWQDGVLLNGRWGRRI